MACRNQVDVILARHGIHHGQNAAIGVHPRPREALLPPGCEVFLGYEVVIIKHGGRIGEVNAMFLMVAGCFAGIL
jgi:hypothetical protein